MSDNKGKGKMISIDTEQIQIVKNLIDECLVRNMSRYEVIEELYAKHAIETEFTERILRDFEEQNRDFFEKYYSNLESVKECSSSGSNIPPINSAGDDRQKEETQRVIKLIEEYIVHNLNRKEIIDVLYEQHNIERSVTEIIFENYCSNLNMKEQHKKQAEMMNQIKDLDTVGSATEFSGSGIPPINSDCGASSLLEKMSFEDDKHKEEEQRVKKLIEECIVRNLNRKEVIDVLYEQHNIERSVTEIILENLEKQNQDFFENYYSYLIEKEQHKKQAEMMNQLKDPDTVASATDSTGSDVSPITSDHEASSLLEKMSTGEDKQKEEKRRVKRRIKHYLMSFTSQKQVIDVLYQIENIEPSVTMAVWEELEQEYPEFFGAYSSSAPPPTEN